LNKVVETPLAYVESPAMTFSSKYREFNAQVLNKQIQTPIAAAAAPVDPSKKKMKWGEPTWFLFHTLAEKIKPEYFTAIKKELLNVIYSICANLPCPTCATHAISYMKEVNFDAISTKDHLRIMLFRFHNEVNVRKNVPEFPYEKLAEKYSSANTVNIIH
jgi:hypothetical protein